MAFLRQRKVIYSDRFIPCRASSKLQLFSAMEKPSSSPLAKEGRSDLYLRLLRAELFGTEAAFPLHTESQMFCSRNMFRYKVDHCSSPMSSLSTVFAGEEGEAERSMSAKAGRRIPKEPDKILGAPSLEDNFYLNLVDWSLRNVLAVGLGDCVYLWNASTNKVTKLCDLGNRDSVCAVQWTPEGSYLAIGTNLGNIQIWDGARCKEIRSMGGHEARTGALAWNNCILASGSRGKNILQHDLRDSNDFISKFSGHRSEVCGLKWSHDNRQLASGGSDNQLLVWNQRSGHPVLKFREHKAAVKAIAWSPHQQDLLASGGGMADCCIRLWNTTKGKMVKCVDTESQVCNLAWSNNVNEIVSTHGYSENEIMLWKYPSMGKIGTLTGHELRVLYLATSPDGKTIVTGSGDETLRFWNNVFPSAKAKSHACDFGAQSMGRCHIR